MAEDDIEYTILQKNQQVCIFQLPPLTNTKGHYLDNWTNMIWEGGMKLVAKNNSLIVQFINKDDKKVYAQGPIPANIEEAVQKTVDSQRGFAVRLQKGGQFAWVGVAFRDRNDAYDFHVYINEFYQKLDRERNPAKYAYEFKPSKDFTSKPGKISISFGGGQEKEKEKQSNNQNQNVFQNQSQNQNQNAFSDFGSFGSGKVGQNASKKTDDFGDFNNFSSSSSQGQQITNQQQGGWGQSGGQAQSQQQQAKSQQQTETVDLL